MDEIGVAFFALLLVLGLSPHLLLGAGYVRRPIGQVPHERRLALRQAGYKVTAVAYVVIGGIALVLDLGGAKRGLELLFTIPSLGVFLSWAVLASALCLVAWTASRRFVPSQIPAELLPRNAGERPLVLSGSLVEEYAFHGYLLALLLSLMIRVPLIPIALVTVCFALFHGPRSEPFVRYLAIGTVLVLPVLATGSLLPSIVARAIVEIASMTWPVGFDPRRPLPAPQ